MDVFAALARDGLDEELARLGLDDGDLATVLGWRSALLEREGDLARIGVLVERLHALVGHRELITGVFEECDEVHELGAGVLPLFALVLAAPAVRAAHAARGIEPEVSEATLADLGMQVRAHRRLTGETGLWEQRWLCHVWADGFVKLGRLQFEIDHSRLRVLDEPVAVMHVHVDRSGPLSPADVDDSLVRASTYLEEHYPEVGPIDWFCCTSWLLDPAICAALPDSQIADFARRWTPFRVRDGREDALRFVFGVQPVKDAAGELVEPELDALPADTALRRALLAAWRAGEPPMVVHGKLPVISSELASEA